MSGNADLEKIQNALHLMYAPQSSSASNVCCTCLLFRTTVTSGPEVVKKNSCPTQLSMNSFLLINNKMPTIGYANSAHPVQTPHNVTSDEGLHCLHLVTSMQNI